ncbi:MAG: hypothetical protein AAGF10_07990, partial [Verrucomicrobiota bacterium]
WEVVIDLPERSYKVAVREPDMTQARRALSSIIHHPDGVESGLIAHLNDTRGKRRTRGVGS